MPESQEPLTYAKSEVDIDVGNRIVDQSVRSLGAPAVPARGRNSADLADYSILKRRGSLTQFWSPPTTALAQR